MKKNIPNSRSLEDMLDCFGNFDRYDTVCLKWCHLSVRCAVVRNQCEQLEVLEDFFNTGVETTRVQ